MALWIPVRWYRPRQLTQAISAGYFAGLSQPLDPSASKPDSRLYRQKFPTFEAYCRERWGLKERHAYKLMDAAAVVENLQSCPIGQVPKTESQARPLTRLEPEVQREVWKEVLAETPHEEITAKVVEEKAKAADPLNEAVKQVKKELKPDPPPPVQQPIIPEPVIAPALNPAHKKRPIRGVFCFRESVRCCTKRRMDTGLRIKNLLYSNSNRADILLIWRM